MDKEQLKQTLEYIKGGATLERIAKKYKMNLRTFHRKLKPFKKEIKLARNYYQMVVERMFNS